MASQRRLRKATFFTFLTCSQISEPDEERGMRIIRKSLVRKRDIGDDGIIMKLEDPFSFNRKIKLTSFIKIFGVLT